MSHETKSKLVNFLYELAVRVPIMVVDGLIGSIIESEKKRPKNIAVKLPCSELATLAERWARELGVEPDKIEGKLTDEPWESRPPKVHPPAASTGSSGFQPGDVATVRPGESNEAAVERHVATGSTAFAIDLEQAREEIKALLSEGTKADRRIGELEETAERRLLDTRTLYRLREKLRDEVKQRNSEIKELTDKNGSLALALNRASVTIEAQAKEIGELKFELAKPDTITERLAEAVRIIRSEDETRFNKLLFDGEVFFDAEGKAIDPDRVKPRREGKTAELEASEAKAVAEGKTVLRVKPGPTVCARCEQVHEPWKCTLDQPSKLEPRSII